MPFYLIWEVGMVPLAGTVAWFLRAILLLPCRGEIGATAGFILLLAVHVAFDAGILSVAVVLVGRLVFWACPARIANFIVALFIAAGVAASFWPIYTITGERDLVSVDLTQVWRQFVMLERPPPPPRRPRYYPWYADPYCDPASALYDADQCRSRHPNEIGRASCR